MELIATSIEQLLAVPMLNGYVEALPAMAEHLTPAGQALAKWYWNSEFVGEPRTIDGFVEQMEEVGIMPVKDEHDMYDKPDGAYYGGEYVEHLGQKYAVTF